MTATTPAGNTTLGDSTLAVLNDLGVVAEHLLVYLNANGQLTYDQDIANDFVSLTNPLYPSGPRLNFSIDFASFDKDHALFKVSLLHACLLIYASEILRWSLTASTQLPQRSTIFFSVLLSFIYLRHRSEAFTEQRFDVLRNSAGDLRQASPSDTPLRSTCHPCYPRHTSGGCSPRHT